VEIDLFIERIVDMPQPKLMHVHSICRTQLLDELRHVTDPLRAYTFGKTVTEKNPVTNHSSIGRRLLDDLARTDTTTCFARAHGARAPADARATTQLRQDSKDARSV